MKSFRTLRKENKKLIHENKQLLKTISSHLKKRNKSDACSVIDKIEDIKNEHKLLFRLRVQIRRFFGRKPMKSNLKKLQTKKQRALRDVNAELKDIYKDLEQ